METFLQNHHHGKKYARLRRVRAFAAGGITGEGGRRKACLFVACKTSAKLNLIAKPADLQAFPRFRLQRRENRVSYNQFLPVRARPSSSRNKCAHPGALPNMINPPYHRYLLLLALLFAAAPAPAQEPVSYRNEVMAVLSRRLQSGNLPRQSQRPRRVQAVSARPGLRFRRASPAACSAAVRSAPSRGEPALAQGSRPNRP